MYAIATRGLGLIGRAAAAPACRFPARAQPVRTPTLAPVLCAGTQPYSTRRRDGRQPQPAVLRRSRLPNAKAKALALASHAIRAQIAEGAPSPVLSSAHVPSSDLPEAAAFATSESYDLGELVASGKLPNGWRWLEDQVTIYIPTWDTAGAHGDIFLFRSGGYVTWGVSPESGRTFYESVIRASGCERDKYEAAGDEAMEYVELPGEATRVAGDLIVLGRGDSAGDEQAESWLALQARLAFSQGMVSSARLSAQEAALARYLVSLGPIPSLLEAGGKVPLKRRDVVTKLGTLLRLRQRANLDRDNFIDDPELYWENEYLECACVLTSSLPLSVPLAGYGPAIRRTQRKAQSLRKPSRCSARAAYRGVEPPHGADHHLPNCVRGGSSTHQPRLCAAARAVGALVVFRHSEERAVCKYWSDKHALVP